MAKKKGGNSFDDFDIDDMDFDFEDPGIKKEKENRKPITRFAEGFYGGVKEQAKSASFYRSVLKKALPKEYGDVLDTIDGIADKGADLYNTSASRLQPTVKAIKKQTRTILPTTDKVIPKALQEKLKKWAEDDYEGEGATFSKVAQQESQINMDLADMFATQITEQAKQNDATVRRDVLREVMTSKRHVQSLNAMDVIRSGISRMVSYQDNITIKYQRKSLELQYRHLYATRDLLEAFHEKSNKQLEALQGITHNTALPDAVKLKNHEAFSNIARDRFINKIQSSTMGGIDKIIERISGNAKRMVGEKIDSINGIVDQLLSAGEMTQGLDKANIAGNVAGSTSLGFLGNKVAPQIGKFLEKNKWLSAALARANAASKNMGGHLDAFAESETNVDRSSLKGQAKGYLLDTLKDLVSNPNKTTIGAGDMSVSANDPSSFTVLTRRSITDIIPGLLSRILREVTVLRTGDNNTPLLSYNLSRGKFTSSTANRDAFRDRILSKENIIVKAKRAAGLFTNAQEEQKSSTGQYVSDLVDKIDPNKKLSANAREALKRQLLHNSLNEKGFIPKQMANVKNYNEAINDSHKSELSNFFKSEFKTDKKRHLGEDLDIDIKESDIGNNFTLLSQTIPAIIDEIELCLMLPDGREHLEELGFLKYANGESKLNYNAIIDFILNSGGRNATSGSAFSKSQSGASAAGYNRNSPTFSFSGNRSNFTFGGTQRGFAQSNKRHDPVSNFRDMVGNAFSSAPIYKAKGKGQYQKVKNRFSDLSERARYQAALVKGEFNNSSQQRADLLDKAKSAYSRTTDKFRDLSDNARYQMWLARNANNGSYLNRAEAEGSSFVKLNATFNGNPIENGASNFKAFSQRADRYRQNNYSSADVNDVVENDLVNTYVDAKRAKGEPVTARGLRDWLSDASKVVNEKLRGKFTFGKVNLNEAVKETEIGSGDVKGGMNREDNSEYESTVVKLLTRQAETMEQMRDLLQAGIHLQTNASGGDGRRFGFRYGLRSGLGKLLSGAGSLLGSGMKFYGQGLSAVGSVIKGAAALGGGLASRLAGGFIRRYSDIYVRGNPNPVVFAKGIKEGRYTDVISGKKIKGLKDIKGPVVDDLGNQVISLEDFEKGLYDVQKKPILNKILNKAIDFYGTILSPYKFAAKATLGLMKFAVNQLTKQTDIYVKGEPLPRMRVSIMTTGGYFSQRTKKPILSIKDLDGPVIDRDGNLILSNDDIRKGLVDAKGRDIKTLGERLWNVGAKVVGMGFKAVKGVAKMAWGVGMGALRLAKGVGIKSYNFLMRGFGLNAVEAVKVGNSNSTVQLLTEIRDIIKDRMPERKRKILGDVDGDGIRENSVEDKLRKQKAATEAKKNKASGERGPGLFAGLTDKLKGLFGKKDEDEEGDGDTNIIGGIGGGKDGANPKKPMGKLGRAWERVKGVGRKIPGARFLGRAGGLLGRGLMGAGRIGLGLLGLDALGLGGTLATAGGVVASGASALVAGAGTVLAGIAAALASPVVLGALAVTAIGVGGYYAYKYFSAAYNNEFKNIRIAQYGINPANEEQANKVLALEEQVSSYVTLNGPTATLKMTPDQITKAMQDFGVDLNDQNHVKSWVVWFNERFKNVYIMHRAACEKTVPGSNLKEMDAKWNKAQKLQALKLVKQDANYQPYSVMESPFTSPLSGDRQIIAKMFEDAEKEFAETKAASSSGSSMLGTAAVTGGFGVTGMGGGEAPKVVLKPKETNTPIDIKAMTAKTAAASSKFNVTGNVTASSSFTSPKSKGTTLTAVDCVRFKAYGLVNLDIDKVRVLQDLERDIIPDIKFSPKGDASFEGKAEDYLDKYASTFGVSSSNTSMVYNWTMWFSKRFIPVLTAYCSAIRTQNKTIMIEDAALYLKPEQTLAIAQSIVAAKSGGFFGGSSIWGFPHSPWEGYELNTDSGSTKGNIDSLTLSVKNKQFADQTAVMNSVVAAAGTESEKSKDTGNVLMNSAKDADKPASIFSTISNIAIVKKSPQPNLVQRTVEGQSSGNFGNSTYMMPVEGRISSSFGMRDHPISGEEKEHKGVDIAAPNGTPIRAAADGVIIVRGFLQGYGNAIYLKHPDGKSTRYAHMSTFQAGQAVGSTVKKGEIIGYVGSTGGSTGNHLHFEVREDASFNGTPIDPIKFLGDKKAEEDIKELKGYANVEKDTTQSSGDGAPMPATSNADSSGSFTSLQPDQAPAVQPAPAKKGIDNSLKVMAPAAPVSSFAGVTAPATPSIEEEPAVQLAKRKQQEVQAARTIEIRNRNESNKANADMSAVVEVLNRSYEVQVQMRDGISRLQTAIESMGNSDDSDPKAAKPTGAANPGRRPTAVPMKANPVSMDKVGY